MVIDGAASLFRWSADGKYLARKGKDLISIYELPSMRLLDKKSLKVMMVASRPVVHKELGNISENSVGVFVDMAM